MSFFFLFFFFILTLGSNGLIKHHFTLQGYFTVALMGSSLMKVLARVPDAGEKSLTIYESNIMLTGM